MLLYVSVLLGTLGNLLSTNGLSFIYYFRLRFHEILKLYDGTKIEYFLNVLQKKRCIKVKYDVLNKS